jgi:hypothetical protein
MKCLFVVISIKKIMIVFVCKKHALFRSDFSYESSFCGEFLQKFLGGTSLPRKFFFQQHVTQPKSEKKLSKAVNTKLWNCSGI